MLDTAQQRREGSRPQASDSGRVPRRGCFESIATVKCAAAAPHSFALKQRTPALNASTESRFISCSLRGTELGSTLAEAVCVGRTVSLSLCPWVGSGGGDDAGGEAGLRSPGCSDWCAFARRIAKAGAARTGHALRAAQTRGVAGAVRGSLQCTQGIFLPESTPTSSMAQRRNARYPPLSVLTEAHEPHRLSSQPTLAERCPPRQQ